jgi:alkyl sulfatase BDS1-like metallo-beta-lactamase superfamily hydrolase
MMRQTTLAEQIRAGKARLTGSTQVLAQLGAVLVEFDPLFEIMPGTR